MGLSALAKEIVLEEGCVDHLYLDTRGNTTCGVGRLVSRAGELGNYTWSDHVAALQDFRTLQEMRRNCEYGMKWPATRYAPLVRARMSNPTEGLTESLILIDHNLDNSFGWYNNAPPEIWNALIDMAYNLGVDGLVRGYPKMLASMDAGDWTAAAAECHRKPPVSEARNERTKARILSVIK